MRMILVVAAAVGAVTSISAPAQDRTGYQAIAAGDFRAAEQTLTAERRIYPSRPELMLNLAAVYQRTGRVADARSLYDVVLSAPDVAMDLPDGRVASSRALAQVGLRRTAQAYAAR